MTKLSKLRNQVVSNDLLLDIILDYVIFDRSDQFTLFSTIYNVRLVHSTWRQSVTRILRKRKKTLIDLCLDIRTSMIGGCYVEEHGKLLNNFMSFATSMSTDFPRLYSSFPPFMLIMDADILKRENRHSLLTFWSHSCTTELIEVKINYEGTAPWIPILPKALFPRLRRVEISISSSFTSPRGNSTIEDSKNMANITTFTQAILNGVEAQGFEFCINSDGSENLLAPETFQNLKLPSTLQNLGIFGSITNVTMEGLLLRCPPQNLTFLQLHFAGDNQFQDGLLFQLLDICKSTLVTLELLEGSIPVLRFPVMKKLKTLTLSEIQFVLETKQQHSMETFLPQLETLTACYCSKKSFETFVGNSRFKNVKELDCNLADEPMDHTDIPLDLEMMEMIHRGFPNVTKLSIVVAGRDTSALEYLFQEMKQLTHLRITVKAERGVDHWDLWDSLLTGLPTQMMKVLRTQPKLREQVYLQHKGCRGIRNLENLTYLQISVHGYIPDRVYAAVAPGRKLKLKEQTLMSKLAFILGFLKML